MTNSTTQQGVPARDPADDATPVISMRDQHLREIAQRRNDEVAEDMVTAAAQSDVPAEPAADAAVDAAAQAAAVTPPVKQKGYEVIDRDGTQVYKLKVYGRETEMTVDEMVARVQKDVAADVRLKNASESEKRARVAQDQAVALQQQLERELAAVRRLPDTPATEQESAELDRAVQSLMDGDAAEARTALQKVLAGRPNTTPSVEVITANVRQSLRQEQAAETQAQQAANEEAELVGALDKFRTTYPDIADDPRLFAYANAETDLVAAEDPTLRPEEIFQRAGARVRQMLAAKAAVTPPTRQELKRSMPPAVTGRTATVSLGEQPTPPPTTSDVISRMRALRGQ